MNTMELAKRTLEEGGYTCVVADGEEIVFTSRERGIRPLVEYCRGAAAAHPGAALADKVIGRAAAMLCRLGSIGELYAGVLSQGALDELNKAGIRAGSETKVEAIRNRDNTGLCPMESLSRGVEDPEEMLRRAEEFLANLGKKPGA